MDELNQAHGLDVIYANFSRILLYTHQLDVVEALSRADGLSRTLQAKFLFAHLDLQYARGWHQLLWYDSANYAGLKVSFRLSVVIFVIHAHIFILIFLL